MNLEQKVVTGEGAIRENLHINLELTGNLVKLVPLSLGHIEGLCEAASSGRLWELEYTTVPSPDQMQEMVEEALTFFLL